MRRYLAIFFIKIRWVTSSILLNLPKGMLPPVRVRMRGHTVHDSFRRLGICLIRIAPSSQQMVITTDRHRNQLSSGPRIQAPNTSRP